MKTKQEFEELFKPLDFEDQIEAMVRYMSSHYHGQFENIILPKKTPLQEFTEQVFAEETAHSQALDLYSDYDKMDSYPSLLSQQPYCDYEKPHRTPLQEFTEEVWADDGPLKNV